MHMPTPGSTPAAHADAQPTPGQMHMPTPGSH
jgi:hypothetical protein